MGSFLKDYGESIYGTRGGPFINDATGGMTWRDHTLYIHVIDWPDNRITLPELGADILKASCLTADTLSWDMKDGHFRFTVSPRDRLALDTIIRL